MGRRLAVVVFFACIAVVLAAGCSALGIPDISPPAGESDSGVRSSPPPSGDSGQTDDGLEPSPAPQDDSSQDADDSQATTAPAAPEVIAGSFAGCWDSPEWGWMQLEAAGTAVSGVYDYDDGRIDAVVVGSVLLGTWSEEPSYAPPDDAGQIEFVLSEDGQSFSGHWRYGEGDGWSGTWSAVRVECEPSTSTPSDTHTLWASKWDTNFGEMELQFLGDQVTGEYEADYGRIEGIVAGRVVTGIWSEAPSYTPPNDAGQFEFTLSEDGRSFDGQWRYDSEGSWRSWWGEVID